MVQPPASEGPGRLERYQQAKSYWEKASQSKCPKLKQEFTKRRSELLDHIRCKLGDTPCICIIGAVAFREGDAELEVLVGHIAEKLAESLQDRVWFVICGMPGVQKVFAEHCGDGSRLRNLVPDGHRSGCGRGDEVSCASADDVAANKVHVGSIDDCRAVFSLLGDAYIIVEGGTGVAQQAKAVASRGAHIIPVMRSRGFPIEAFARPDFMDEDKWALLKSGVASTAETVDVVVASASNFVAQRGTTKATAEVETGPSHTEATEVLPIDDDDVDVVLCPPPVGSSQPLLRLQLQSSLPCLPPRPSPESALSTLEVSAWKPGSLVTVPEPVDHSQKEQSETTWTTEPENSCDELLQRLATLENSVGERLSQEQEHQQEQRQQPEQCFPAAELSESQGLPPVDPRRAGFLERVAIVASKAETLLQDSPLQDISGRSAPQVPTCSWPNSCDNAVRAEFIERVAALAAQVEILQTDPMKTAVLRRGPV